MNNEVIDSYLLETWIGELGSKPVRLVSEKDYAGSYEKREAHVYELENGQFALVTENGCSCYSSSDASICLFPTLGPAMESYDRWCKENEGEI